MRATLLIILTLLTWNLGSSVATTSPFVGGWEAESSSGDLIWSSDRDSDPSPPFSTEPDGPVDRAKTEKDGEDDVDSPLAVGACPATSNPALPRAQVPRAPAAALCPPGVVAHLRC